MRLIYSLLFFTLSLPLFSCAIVPTQEELTNADYGNPPTNYKQTIKSFLADSLKDPASAKYTFLSKPTPQWSRYYGEIEFGYGTCVAINAKNSFGGYSGKKLHFFLIYNDLIMHHIYQSARRHDSLGEAAVKRCS